MSETSLENLFSLDHLSPTEFEDLCFDLLKALGYEDISWRKGTNSDASPADGGRDIECVFEYSDPDGSKFRQKWFVECKHHKNAVPAEKLNSAMTAALSQNIDVLLIATSGFLSNPAKDSLRNFSNNHQGTAKRIKIWEKKDFEYLIFKYSFLMSKYKIGPQFPFLSRIHPLHAHFIDSINISSELNHFFKVIEDIPEYERDDFLFGVLDFYQSKIEKINK